MGRSIRLYGTAVQHQQDFRRRGVAENKYREYQWKWKRAGGGGLVERHEQHGDSGHCQPSVGRLGASESVSAEHNHELRNCLGMINRGKEVRERVDGEG